jgi:hypothetical protein
MNILYINVIEQNFGWGAEYFVNKGFLKNNIETQCIDYRNYRYNLVNKYKEISDFDALLLQRGDWFPKGLLKAVNRPKFFWASELVSRCRDQDRLLKSGLFNHIFVHTNDCLRSIVRNGWVPKDRISVLLNGFDTDTQYKIENIEKDIDILFIGNITNRRREVLKDLQKDFHITIMRGFGTEMTEIVNRSKVVLNIHADEYLDTETRIFECLGCGAFVISEKLSEENPFIHNKHLVEVNSVVEMKSMIKFYLENEDERNHIASNGYKEAHEKHTYVHRAIEIASIMSTYISKNFEEPLDYHYLDKYKYIEIVCKFLNFRKVEKFIYKYLKTIKDVFVR